MIKTYLDQQKTNETQRGFQPSGVLGCLLGKILPTEEEEEETGDDGGCSILFL